MRDVKKQEKIAWCYRIKRNIIAYNESIYLIVIVWCASPWASSAAARNLIKTRSFQRGSTARGPRQSELQLKTISR